MDMTWRLSCLFWQPALRLRIKYECSLGLARSAARSSHMAKSSTWGYDKIWQLKLQPKQISLVCFVVYLITRSLTQTNWSSGGRDIAQAVSRRLPTTAARVRGQVMLDLCWEKWHWCRFSPSTSVSPASGPGTLSHSGRRTKWTQSQPPPQEKKT
jgi:hypothetical protein